MFSLRTKIISSMCLLILLINTVSCLILSSTVRKEHVQALIKTGISLANLISQDEDVKIGISDSEPVFFEKAIKQSKAFNRQGEIAYISMIGRDGKTKSENKFPLNGFKIDDIPLVDEFEMVGDVLTDEPLVLIWDNLINFLIPVYEPAYVSDEVFASKMFSENNVFIETAELPIGFVQLGLSTHILDKEFKSVLFCRVVPMGLTIVCVGVVITLIFARQIVSPLRQMADITLSIAKGDLSKSLDIHSNDEIGQLSNNFNKMTNALKTTYDQLEKRIVEHQRTEETLRLSESKSRMLLENLPQSIYLKDKNLAYVSCNMNFALNLNKTPDYIVGKTDYDLYPKLIAKRFELDEKAIIRSGQVVDKEDKYKLNGSETIIQSVKAPVKDDKGDVVGILGVFWDISEKRRLQMEAIRSRHLASIGELAAGVAHEINNPVNGVINCAQILLNRSKKNGNACDISNRIIKDGNRIASIVRSMLSFSRPGGKDDFKSVKMQNIIDDTLILIHAQLRKDGINLKQNIPDTFPLVNVNQQQIQQVFLNVISNAQYSLNRKYPHTDKNKVIEIRCEKKTDNKNQYVSVIFDDYGEGISAKLIDKVMEPFFTLKPRGKGTGLGLSISHGIINDHGGEIVINSVEGKYTKVKIDLPV